MRNVVGLKTSQPLALEGRLVLLYDDVSMRKSIDGVVLIFCAVKDATSALVNKVVWAFYAGPVSICIVLL